MWFSNTGSGSNLTSEAHTVNFERSTVLGCHCTGWKEGAVGTLSYKERQSKEGSSLQQELKVFNYILSGLVAENQACVLAGSVRALHCNFPRIDISSGTRRMSQASENVGIMDVKKNLRRLYEMIAIVIMDNKEIAQEVKNMGETVSCTSLQINNHDARINDNESNLREITVYMIGSKKISSV